MVASSSKRERYEQVNKTVLLTWCGSFEYIVRPELITSSYDSNVYIFEGNPSKPDIYRLDTEESSSTKRMISVYNIDDSNAMCGMKVKSPLTFWVIKYVLHYS